MSSPITSLQATTAAQPALPTAAIRSSEAARGSGAPFSLEPTVSHDAVPSSPPREVLEEMASAAHTYEALSSQGRELRFARDERSGRTRIEVRDRDGHVLRTLSPAQALEVAAGAPLD